MVTHQIEIERKYDVRGRKKPKLKLGKLEGFTAGEAVEHDMSAVYCDTADLLLARSAVAARRRSGGADDGWHVKYEAGKVRGELHFPTLKTAPTRLPAALRKALLGLTLGEDLVPVATVDTHRTLYPVLGEDGQWAELCVDTVNARDERTGITRAWTECEVELSREDLTEDQARTVFDAVEAVLFAAGAEPSSSAAKIARALGQDGGDTVRVVSPVAAAEEDAAEKAAAEDEKSGGKKSKKNKKGEKGKKSTKGKKDAKASEKSGRGKGDSSSGKKGKDGGDRTGADVLAGMVGHLTTQLQLWDFAVRVEAPDAVHQMRIRSRALRSVLQACQGFVDEETATDLRQRLKGLARVLGDARDQDVSVERLDALLDAQPAGLFSEAAETELRESAQELGTGAARAVRRELDSESHLQLIRDLRALAGGEGIMSEAAELSPKKFAKTVLGGALERVLDTASTALPEPGAEAAVSSMAQEVAERICLPGQDPLQTAAAFDVLHETRKAAKSARYVSEALNAVEAKAGKKRTRAAVVAKDYQDDLGVITDAAVTEEWLVRAARSFQRTGKDRYAVGVLHGMVLTELRNGMLESSEILEDLVADLREALPSDD